MLLRGGYESVEIIQSTHLRIHAPELTIKGSINVLCNTCVDSYFWFGTVGFALDRQTNTQSTVTVMLMMFMTQQSMVVLLHPPARI